MKFNNLNLFFLIQVISLNEIMQTTAADETLASFSIKSTQALIKSKKYTCSQVIDYFLQRAYTYNSLVNALISFNPLAKKQAIELDEYFRINNRLKGPMHCVPVLIKDNINVAGIATTGAIKALRYSIPNKDAPLVANLLIQGAVIVGKTNMAELAVANEDTEMGGQCKNPFDTRRTCGSSSTGCGSGISTGMGLVAIGTDTGGSIICKLARKDQYIHKKYS